MEKREMVESLVNYYSNGNKNQFANMLGVSAQTVSAWIRRNTFDAELIYTKCRLVSADWLLSGGQGEMVKSESKQIHNVLPTNTKELIQFCSMLVDNYKERDALLSKLADLVGNV